MKASIITPTYLRGEAWHRNLYACFQSQTNAEIELLIADDSPAPVEFWQTVEDDRVHYFYSSQKGTVGAKRNFLIQQAKGDVIIHFDDDDYYAPTYVEKSLTALGNADFLTLDGWYAFDCQTANFFYWDTGSVGQCHYKIAPRAESEIIYTEGISDEEKIAWIEPTRWGFGFSYVYRKAIFEQVAFDDADFGEDYQLVKKLSDLGCQLATWQDQDGCVLHLIHGLNISIIFPQYLLPNFLLSKVFDDSLVPYLATIGL